jgi:hypothetical protein
MELVLVVVDHNIGRLALQFLIEIIGLLLLPNQDVGMKKLNIALGANFKYVLT